MTNVFQTPEKGFIRKRLFQIAEEVLEREGWRVERVAGSGKASVRHITKGEVRKTVSIRTTQDTWVAFPRNITDDAWATLADVDYVIASSVDNPDEPRFARVHMIEGDEMRARFDRAYAARMKANYSIPVGRGVWLSLYEKEAYEPVTLVGAGAGLDYPAIATVPLNVSDAATAKADVSTASDRHEQNETLHLVADEQPQVTQPVTAIDERKISQNELPLTIPEAKRRLALSLGVSVSDIKIIITS